MQRTTTALAVAVLLTSALPLAANAEPGLYVGASIGNARLDDDFDRFLIDTDTNAYRFPGPVAFLTERLYINDRSFNNRFCYGSEDDITVCWPASRI